MHCKLAVITVVMGLLPLVTLGEATNQEPKTLRLQVTCRSGVVVILDDAALMEQGLRRKGTNPQAAAGSNPPSLRLAMPEAGTVTILWNDIEKITVGARRLWEKTYPLNIKLKNVEEMKAGRSYGYDNTLVGQSDIGAFSIQLDDVQEIIVLPPAEEKKGKVLHN